MKKVDGETGVPPVQAALGVTEKARRRKQRQRKQGNTKVKGDGQECPSYTSPAKG